MVRTHKKKSTALYLEQNLVGVQYSKQAIRKKVAIKYAVYFYWGLNLDFWSMPKDSMNPVKKSMWPHHLRSTPGSGMQIEQKSHKSGFSDFWLPCYGIL